MRPLKEENILKHQVDFSNYDQTQLFLLRASAQLKTKFTYQLVSRVLGFEKGVSLRVLQTIFPTMKVTLSNYNGTPYYRFKLK